MRGVQERAGASLKTSSPRACRVLLLGVAVLAYLADLGTKTWALSALADGQRRALIGDLLGFRLIFNPGAAFSLGSGSTWLFSVVAIGVVVLIIRWSRRLTSRLWTFTLALLLAGALGNLTDRLFREPGPGRGHVVDFIDYGWFIGNVADIWIVAAAIAMALLTLTGVPLSTEPSENSERREESGQSEAGDG